MPRRLEAKPTTTAGRASGRGRGGVPTRATFKSILTRSAIFAAILFVLLLLIAREPPLGAALLVGVFFVLSIPLGFFFDRMRYRAQMRRLERRKAGS
jgi:preprotein translocase subunit SecG